MALGVGIALASQRAASAGEDQDLDRIPKIVTENAQAPPPTAAPSPPPASRRTLRGKFFLEDALTVPSAPRAVPVPYPTASVDWQNRTSFDASLQWQPWRELTLTLSDRINLVEQSDVALLSRQTLTNNFKEGFVTWEPAAGSYLEAGRINVRSGVALGYNPTDFFKTRTLVGQASLDPSVIRQNRLGTLMVRGQQLWNGGSATVSFAPKLYEPTALVQSDPLGIDPRLDATNAASRLLCTLNLEVADLSPQVLVYFERHRSKVGLDVTRPLGSAVVAYLEWAGGPETNLVSRGVAYGASTGAFPPSTPALPPTTASNVFRNDLAAGASWTIATAATLNVEYHFHDAGFSRGDWKNWSRIGSAAGAPPAVTGELWYVRGYALDQQEPVAMHQVFVRLDWPDALVKHLELTGFAFVDLVDGSVLTQASASYYLSDAWTIAGYASFNLGDGRTERGSVPQMASGTLQVVRYL
jgi:hypothetical protein